MLTLIVAATFVGQPASGLTAASGVSAATPEVVGATISWSEKLVWFDVERRPAKGVIEFDRLNQVVQQIVIVDQPELPSLQLSQSPHRWQIALPDEVRYPARLRMQLDTPMFWRTQPHVQMPSLDGTLVLSARHAVVHGEKLQFEPLTYKNTVGYWVNPQDWVEWSWYPRQSGVYDVWILQGCGAGQGGSRVVLSAQEQSLEFEVQETGHFQNFVWRRLGQLPIRQGEVSTLSLRVAQLARNAVMDVRQIRLVPACANDVSEPSSPLWAHGSSAQVDLTMIEPDLVVPITEQAAPRPGRRVRLSISTDANDRIYPTLYLPTDWQPGHQYPVLVELPGNGFYQNEFGDSCTGDVAQTSLGMGVSGGFGYLWLTLPFLDDEGTQNVNSWWGTPPDYRVKATLDYWQRALTQVCEQYGGRSDQLVLVGFSRGSIATNYLGLADDSVARHWRAFINFSHYDGVLPSWPYPEAGRQAAAVRLGRLAGRPVFVCSESSAVAGASLSDTMRYLDLMQVPHVTARPTGFRNHSDAWILRPSPCRAALRQWLAELVADDRSRRPGVTSSEP